MHYRFNSLAALYGFLVFFVDFFEQKGFGRASVLLLYSHMNIVSTIFRFVPGIIAQSLKIPKLATPAMYAFLGCLSLSLLPFKASYSLNAVVIALYGYIFCNVYNGTGDGGKGDISEGAWNSFGYFWNCQYCGHSNRR